MTMNQQRGACIPAHQRSSESYQYPSNNDLIAHGGGEGRGLVHCSKHNEIHGGWGVGGGVAAVLLIMAQSGRWKKERKDGE